MTAGRILEISSGVNFGPSLVMLTPTAPADNPKVEKQTMQTSMRYSSDVGSEFIVCPMTMGPMRMPRQAPPDNSDAFLPSTLSGSDRC